MRPPTWDGVASGSFPTDQSLVSPVAQTPAVVVEEANPFASTNRNKKLAWVALGVVALVSGIFAVAHLSGQPEPATVSSPAATVHAQTQKQAPGAAEAKHEDPSQHAAPSAVEPSPAFGPNPTPGAPGVAAQRRMNVRVARPKRAGETGTASSNQEPDPGF